MGQLIDVTVLHSLAVGEGGILQNVLHRVGGIGRQNNVVGVPGQQLLVGNLAPVGVGDIGGHVGAVGVFDQGVLVHGGTGGFQHAAVAGKIDGGGLSAGNSLGQSSQRVGDMVLQSLTGGDGVGGFGQQVNGVKQLGLILGLDSQNGQTQFFHGGDGVLQLGGNDDKVRLQGGAALQIKFLGGADAGQRLNFGRGQSVQAALVGLGLDADQLILDAEGDQQAGGNVVAAGQGLGLGLNGDLAAQLVGDGQGIGDGSIGGSLRSRRSLALGSALGHSSAFGSALGRCGGGTAGSQGQAEGGGEQQGSDLSQFHANFLSIFRIFKKIRCIFKTTTEL